MTDVQILSKITGESDEELLSLLLEISEERILALTNRSTITPGLKGAVRDYAVIAYNRMGMEGETSRSEAGISSAFVEIPKNIQDVINQNRLARVSGHAYEKKSDETNQPEAAGSGQSGD